MSDTQIGILSVVASTGGIQLDDDKTWINPTKEAKPNILKNIESIKKLKGTEVLIYLDEMGNYKSIIPSGQEELIEEETLTRQVGGFEKPIVPKPSPIQDDKEVFSKLFAVPLETEKKGNTNLIYVSWAEAWEKLKRIDPDANYAVHENKDGLPYFADHSGAYVKVTVFVFKKPYTVWLPVMDYNNKGKKIDEVTSTDVNKTIQRCFVKAIAMSGLGLAVFKGEDIKPEE